MINKIKASGVTLVALVITIIVLLILAGVSLNLTLGENGLLKKAELAKAEHENAKNREKNELEKAEEYIIGTTKELPENTLETEAGTMVKIPEKWVTETPSYIENGKEIVSSKKVSTVEAISVGNAQTVPVPVGFYYVGGTLESGVVISDNEADRNKYAGVENVPSGLKQNAEGNIEYEIAGNQFVWIPCELSEYKKTNWGQGNVANRSNMCWDTTVDRAGELQTKKYGGFYVARFEAGLDSEIEEYTTTQKNDGTNRSYNTLGKAQSKPGVVPWNFIDWNNSKENAKSMYSTNTVESGLITGTQWDVMINWITNKDNEQLTNSINWGNYAISTPVITLGRMAYSYVSSKWWYTEPFADTWMVNIEKPLGVVNTTGNGKGHLWTTGASEESKKKNMYDVAGNVFEWTEETSFAGGNSANQYRECRGGSAYNGNLPACYRDGQRIINYNNADLGFRVVLYIK